MPIRSSTGRLLQVRAFRPMRGMWVSAVPLSTSSGSPSTSMSDAFEADRDKPYLIRPYLSQTHNQKMRNYKNSKHSSQTNGSSFPRFLHLSVTGENSLPLRLQGKKIIIFFFFFFFFFFFIYVSSRQHF